MLRILILAFIGAVNCAVTSRFHIRAQCDSKHVLCAPEEARTNETPSVGSDMVGILGDLMSSVALTGNYNGHANRVEVKATLAERAPSGDLCCEIGASCLLLEKRLLPFCYDQFTTDFVLPGGATGNINTGRYNASNGDTVNLHTGSYILQDGTSGNIYAGAADQPEISATATLPALRPFVTATPTSTAPDYEIRHITLEGTTKAATTIPASIIPFVLEGGRVIIPEVSIPPTVVQGTTIPQEIMTVTVPVRQLGDPFARHST